MRLSISKNPTMKEGKNDELWGERVLMEVNLVESQIEICVSVIIDLYYCGRKY